MSDLASKLHPALLKAFPKRDKLALMLGLRFGVSYDLLAAESTVDVEYWEILTQIDAEGWLEDFARAAHETVPKNPALAALILGARMSSAPPGPVLERMVRDNSSLSDVPTFLARLQALEAQVCRIEAPGAQALGTQALGTQALGTGFLVGPDLVMTNHHVVAEVAGPGLTCRFDYLTDAAGVAVRAGVVVGLAADWLVAACPHDPADLSLEDTDEPAPGTLDMALLRLSRAVGHEPRQGDAGPDNPPRGWVRADAAVTLAESDDIFILQHPAGAPLKLGSGRVSALRPGPRLRHDVTTEPGSSGSPVFDGALQLAGLHHLGDPNSFRNAAFNQAIPMPAILDWLAAQGLPPLEQP